MQYYQTKEEISIWNRIFEYKHEKDVILMVSALAVCVFVASIFVSVVFKHI